MKSSEKLARSLLERYKPSYSEELVYKKKMLEFMSSYEDCFLRSCRAGHFTASAFLLNKEKSHALLMHHTKLDKWMQLGGHCDGDADLLNVAIKEAREESGIHSIKPVSLEIFDLDIHLIPPRKEEGEHCHFDIRFLLYVHDSSKFQKNHESKELRWIDINSTSLPSKERSVIRMFEKVRKINF